MADKALKTSVFIWEGTDKKGSKVKGELAGQNPMLVKAQLRKQGINPLKVRKKGITLFGAGKKIKPMDIALFTRQMSTMMGAGVPLLQSFDIIGEGFENPNMRKLVDEIKQDVAAGNSLASSLRKKPIYFDDLYCNLVDAGEQSGALETLLDRVATYKEKTESLKAKIKKSHDLSHCSNCSGPCSIGDPSDKSGPTVPVRICKFWCRVAGLYSNGHQSFRDASRVVAHSAYWSFCRSFCI